MKKSKLTLVGALLISGSIMFSSCLGSFSLFNKVLTWNQEVGDKFVNELVFLACWIVPVYEITFAADMIVFNSLEFWTGSNPLATKGDVKTIHGKNGDYLVQTNENGYTISQGDQTMNLVYDAATNTWSAEANGHSAKLVTINNDGTALMYSPDGTTTRVTLDAQGLTAARAIK